MDYERHISPEIQEVFDRQLNDFIVRYNTQTHPFVLTPCADPETSSLRLHISDTRLVNSSQQAAGVIISTIGMSLPILMASAGAEFVVWFYYFPEDISVARLSLSNDISEVQNFQIERKFSNNAFLMRHKRQVRKHTKKFDWFLSKILSELATNHKRNLKRTGNVSQR